jgi:hypothetical protein
MGKQVFQPAVFKPAVFAPGAFAGLGATPVPPAATDSAGGYHHAGRLGHRRRLDADDEALAVVLALSR